MTVFKSGDLVQLKSGGPVMTVDTVNTDILDDNKVTGLLCVWFVGDKLERVRFDHRAIEPAVAPTSQEKAEHPQEAAGEYGVVLDEMVTAMNVSAEADNDAARIVARKPARKRAKPKARHDEAVATPGVQAVAPAVQGAGPTKLQ